MSHVFERCQCHWRAERRLFLRYSGANLLTTDFLGRLHKLDGLVSMARPVGDRPDLNVSYEDVCFRAWAEAPCMRSPLLMIAAEMVENPFVTLTASELQDWVRALPEGARSMIALDSHEVDNGTMVASTLAVEWSMQACWGP